MSEHVHDFKHAVIDRPWAHEGMPFEVIRGYRCECGEFSSMRRPVDFSPAAQIRAVSEYVRRRYAGTTWAAWTTTTAEDPMAKTTVEAPANPYRRQLVDGFHGIMPGVPAIGRAPRRHDGDSGPGLTAGDIDAIARDHFRDGRAAAEREYEAKIEALQAQLADAFDEGFTAGRVERAQGLAREVFSRLFEPHVKVVEARALPRQRTREALDDIEAALKDVQEFVSGLFTPHDADAPARAAAQIARDEP